MKPKKCKICKSPHAKYKCPKCASPYCSVECNRNHREACKPPVPVVTIKKELDPLPERVVAIGDEDELANDSPDYVHPSKLSKLVQNNELVELLKDSKLREMIQVCNRAVNKEETLKEFMKNDLFTKFANICLATVDSCSNIYFDIPGELSG